MSELKMTEENKKTITAFIAGLLIGGLLVFIFTNPTANESDTNEVSESETTQTVDEVSDNETDEDAIDEVVETVTDTPVMDMGDANVELSDQAAGDVVILSDVTFPSEAGWIGVRDYENGQLTGLLGVVRWNQDEGLVPSEVPLLRVTESGRTYAVVFYSDNGDKEFNLADDAQISGVITTFTAE